MRGWDSLVSPRPSIQYTQLTGNLTGISEETRSGKAVGSGCNTHDILVVLESMKLEPIHAEVDFGFGIEIRWHNGGVWSYPVMYQVVRGCGLTQSCIRW